MRRNIDEPRRDLERRLQAEPELGLQLFYARRRAESSIEDIDYEALAGFEIADGEIPYEIDLELEFPYLIAKHVWDQRPSIQAWYRLNKIQHKACDVLIAEYALEKYDLNLNKIDYFDYYEGIEDDEAYEELEALRESFIVKINDNKLADLWAKDIESRLYRTWTKHHQDYYTAEQIKHINGLIEENKEGNIELVYFNHFDKNGEAISAENGSLFILRYGLDCCYDTEWKSGGTVSVQAFGYHGRIGLISDSRGIINFSMIEYGRHFRQVIPEEALKEIVINAYESPAYPLTRTPLEERKKRGIIENILLRKVVNGAHLFDIIRDHYKKYIPQYKEWFENLEGYMGEYKNKRYHDKLVASEYYNPNYSHLWQISKYIEKEYFPEEDFYFQQYKFTWREDGLYVECPVTNKEIHIEDWDEHSSRLIQDMKNG